MAARFAGLPQAQKHGVDFAAQPCQRVGIGAAFALRQQRADAAVEIQNGLALHFGRVRGQNGGNGRIVQLPLHRFAVGFPALSLRTVSVRLPSAALWYGIFVDLAAAFVVHVFGDIQNLGEQPAGKRQIVGLPFVQLRQYFFNQCRAVVGSGQEFDRFDNQRRGFFVQEVEQGLFQNSASAAKAASFGLFRICSCMIFLSLP